MLMYVVPEGTIKVAPENSGYTLNKENKSLDYIPVRMMGEIPYVAVLIQFHDFHPKNIYLNLDPYQSIHLYIFLSLIFQMPQLIYLYLSQDILCDESSY